MKLRLKDEMSLLKDWKGELFLLFKIELEKKGIKEVVFSKKINGKCIFEETFNILSEEEKEKGKKFAKSIEDFLEEILKIVSSKEIFEPKKLEIREKSEKEIVFLNELDEGLRMHYIFHTEKGEMEASTLALRINEEWYYVDFEKDTFKIDKKHLLKTNYKLFFLIKNGGN